jgi:carbon starvation protein CstA
MIHRFAAATSVAAIIIAAGALGSLLLRLPHEGAWWLTIAWCFVPAVWGVWAMLAPARWVPGRLPLWGAILGLAAGIIVGPVLDLPRLFGAPNLARWAVLVVAPIVYYLFWLGVRAAYRALHRATEAAAAAR